MAGLADPGVDSRSPPPITAKSVSPSPIVRLNVGGTIFVTTRATLESSPVPTYFNALTSDSHRHLYDDMSNALFIDRDPQHFRHILNYLRDGSIPLTRSNDDQQLLEILKEAQYYSIEGLVEKIKLHLNIIDSMRAKEKSGEKEYKIVHAPIHNIESINSTVNTNLNRGWDLLSCSCMDRNSTVLCFVKYLSRSQTNLLDRLSKN